MTSPDVSTARSTGSELEWGHYPTACGDAWMEWDSSGLRRLGLPGATPPPGDPAAALPPALRPLAVALGGYFAGEAALPDAGPLIDRLDTTPLFRAIYEVVASIPPGGTATYAEVARRAGRPAAARAVGAAMAANRFAPIVPCHRVVGSDGSLRGYAGGLEMKRSLLAMEAATNG